jgi:hypothetical protein
MEEISEQEQQANQEHERLAELNKNEPYVDLWKQTRVAKEEQQQPVSRKKLNGA